MFVGIGCDFCGDSNKTLCIESLLKTMGLDLKYCPVCGVNLEKQEELDALRRAFFDLYANKEAKV